MRCCNSTTTRLPAYALISSASIILGAGLMADRNHDRDEARADAASVNMQGQPEGQPDMEALMAMEPAQLIAMMQEMSKPDEHHAFLKKFAGDFDCTLQMWMDPTDKPTPTPGYTESQWQLGGRYLTSDFVGSFSFGGANVPLKGIGILGYDRIKGQYFSVWMDSMSTGVMMLPGVADTNAGTLTFDGMVTSFAGESRMKNVYTLTEKGYTMEFFEPNPMDPAGELANTGIITYTRR